MKRNLQLAFIAAIMSFTSMSHAEFIFHLNTPNACDSISGHWSGKGRATNWLLGECSYHGSGEISTVDSTGHFTVNVTADKDSGSPFCPAHSTEKLNAVCANGVVTVKTEFGNLVGNFSDTSGSAKGTLTVSPGMDADVSIKFQRAG